MPESDVLEANYWVLGDDTECVFLVEIPRIKTVGALKKVIKDEKQQRLGDIGPDTLVLWKVSDYL
jgi:hypothetical protein